MSTAGHKPTQESGQRRPHSRLWKVAAWAVISVVALAVVTGIAVTVVLHSARFHNYVLATVQKRASESIGTQVQLQNFALHLSNLSLDLYGLTVHGADPYPNPPLLQVAHAEVGIRIVSVLRRKWYLDNFIVDQPGGEGIYRRAWRDQHPGDQKQRFQQ